MFSEYRNSRVLVTGGLGFIGSNLVLRLAALGAAVSVVDSSEAGCGANFRNLHGAAAPVRIIGANIADAAEFAAEIRSCDLIFNLAGEVSHIQSMRQPGRDQELNATAQLRFLEECVKQRPGVRVVYASTRQIYGVPRYLPVDENHPIQPIDINGIHKYAATAYHQVFTSSGKLDALVLCLTNVYGPRMALNLPAQGFLGGFLRKGLLKESIEIFGDGSQVRDPVYVDDAVDALLRAGVVRNPRSRLWNVGGRDALPIATLASIIASAAGAPAPVFRTFPKELKTIDIGSYRSNSSRIHAQLGWTPRVPFKRGVGFSLEFYRREVAHYLNGADYQPAAPDLWCAAGPHPVAV